MSNTSKAQSLGRHIRPMVARSDDVGHRAATPLELLFDLVSVIAIATAANGLHHAIVENHAAVGLLSFVMAFFSIWWAWMHFTWFASSYDNDDIVYRLSVFVMLAGSLCLTAGVKNMFTHQDFSLGVLGYVIMRVAHVGLLWRASQHNPALKVQTRAYAFGIVLSQVGWISGFFFIPMAIFPYFFFAMVAFELMVPAIVSRYGRTSFHKAHIAERFGLLTIIVLGESLLAISWAIQKATDAHANKTTLLVHIIAGLVSMFAMWWIYFGEKDFRALDKMNTVYLWSYGHVIIFISIAAFGAGLAVNLDYVTHHAEISELVSNLSMALPAAGFLLGIWLVHERFNANGGGWHLIYLGLAICCVAAAYLPYAVLIIAAILFVAATLKTRFKIPVRI